MQPASIASPAGAAAAPRPAAAARSRHPYALVAVVSLWIASIGNIALWRELVELRLLDGAHGMLFAAAVTGVLMALLVAAFSLFVWRASLKPALIGALITSAIAAHFMLSYRVVLDTAMLNNVLQTNPAEARDLVSLRLFATVLLLGVLPAAWVWRAPVQRVRWPRQAAHNVAALLGGLAVTVLVLLVSFQTMSSAMRGHRHLRHLVNPLNVAQALVQNAAARWQRPDTVVLPLGEDARLGASYGSQRRPPLMVLVIGETGRAGNFSLNGYARQTTPELAALDVVSLRNAWACGTSTAASVPCMFSHLGREAYENREHNQEGLLDVLQRAGLAVLWLDNQGGCKGVCARVPSATIAGDAELCSGSDCFDEVLLRGLDERIAALPAERRARGVVLVLHPMGSHGPAYHKRSPAAFKRYLPECASNQLQDCSSEQLVNAYDNSIAYADHFLAETIRWLKARERRFDTAMVYVADHGESLGESNLYLHGMPYRIAPDVQKRVPWITWLSPGFARRAGLSAACLAQRRDLPVSHDHYFHSVLGLLDVGTSVYHRQADLYAPCAAAAGAAAP